MRTESPLLAQNKYAEIVTILQEVFEILTHRFMEDVYYNYFDVSEHNRGCHSFH